MKQAGCFASSSRIVAACRPKDSRAMSVCSTDGDFFWCSQCFVILARWTWQCRNCGNSCIVCDVCARQPSPCCSREGDDLEIVELAFASPGSGRLVSTKLTTTSTCAWWILNAVMQLEQADASSTNSRCSRCFIIIARWKWPCCSCTPCFFCVRWLRKIGMPFLWCTLWRLRFGGACARQWQYLIALETPHSNHCSSEREISAILKENEAGDAR